MEECLMHYGVKNQKWGIRRFQNEDGSLTAEGKKRYSKESLSGKDLDKKIRSDAKIEYKADNREAFRLGKVATVSGQALKKAEKRRDKRPNNEVEQKVYEKIKENHIRDLENAKKHHAELMKKYGDKAVSDIRYNKKGWIDEEVTTTGEAVAAGILSAVGMAVPLALGSPVGFITIPKSKRSYGSDYYRYVKKEARKELNSGN